MKNNILKICSLLMGLFLIVYIQTVIVRYEINKEYPALPKRLSCLSYEPQYINNERITSKNPLTVAQAQREIAQIKKITNCIRIYNFSLGMGSAYKVAQDLDMDIIAGVWLDANHIVNSVELNTAINEIPKYKNIKMFVVGNETQLTQRITEDELVYYLKIAKSKVRVPITTAEFAYFWNASPKVLKHVDVIGLHVFPYWNGSNPAQGVEEIVQFYDSVKEEVGRKKIYVLETGWPTEGNFRDSAVAGLTEQRKFLVELNESQIELGGFVNIIETYDQPWKITESEGRSGGHWGVYDAKGKDKVDSKRDLAEKSGMVSVSLAVFFGFIFSFRYFKLKYHAHLLSYIFINFISFVSVFAVKILIIEYLFTNWFVLFVMIPTQIILIGILSVHFLEVIRYVGESEDFLTNVERRANRFDGRPLVSIHIPCRNEDPKQVIECVESCLNQEYKNIEIILVENNSTDLKYCEPLYDYANKLKAQGENRLKFFHVENLKGFKAGALNFAITKTDELAKIIAIIDSDYIVSPLWLEKCVPYMGGNVKVVQSPQSYRSVTGSTFEKSVILEQSMFFEIGMNIRNNANAIIQHGTMCLIDRDALTKVGGWGEWCITEDTELGIRLFKEGYEAVYLGMQLGSGIPPATFEDYSKQRFRWVYGAVRIMLTYWKDFFGFGSKLSLKQRYYFITGWIYWLSHVFLPFFIMISFVGTYLVMVEERRFPPMGLIYSLIVYVAAELLMAFFVSKKISKAKTFDILAMMSAGLSLTPVIMKAVLVGLFYKKKPFEVTGKLHIKSQLIQGLYNIRWSIYLVLLCLVQFEAVYSKYAMRNPDVRLFELSLILLVLPFVAQIYMVVLSWISNKDISE